MTVFTADSKATFLGANWTLISDGKTCHRVNCDHCGKKLPKYPFIVEIEGVEHTVGADCILDNIGAFADHRHEDMNIPKTIMGKTMSDEEYASRVRRAVHHKLDLAIKHVKHAVREELKTRGITE